MSKSVKFAAVTVALGISVLSATACSSANSESGQPPITAQNAADAKHTGPNPYQYLKQVPSFTVTSQTIKDGQPLPKDQQSAVFSAPGGQDISPQLSWSGFPKGTKSFVVTMYDPQAPTGSGFWHWAVADIPASTTSLPLNAGVPNSTALPAGAFQAGADAGMPRYFGGAPGPGTGVHNYYITVSALDEAKTGMTAKTTGAYLGFTIASHTIGRATLVAPTAAS